MKLNRNHYFLVGLLLLLVGLQFRFVESVVLNADSSRFVAEQIASSGEQSFARVGDFLPGRTSDPLRRVTPPNWVGWVLISAGSVLVLHSLAMPKAGAGGNDG